MSQTTGTDVQEAIERMIRDVIRVPCSKILMSPAVYRGCLERIADRYTMFGDVTPLGPPTGEVFVHGVKAEKCTAMSGTDYAMVPRSPDSTITVNEVPLEFIPPHQIT